MNNYRTYVPFLLALILGSLGFGASIYSMDKKPSYYDMLQVRSTATQEEIFNAWQRKNSALFDRYIKAKSGKSSSEFKQLQKFEKIRKILGDPKTRMQYDAKQRKQKIKDNNAFCTAECYVSTTTNNIYSMQDIDGFGKMYTFKQCNHSVCIPCALKHDPDNNYQKGLCAVCVRPVKTCPNHPGQLHTKKKMPGCGHRVCRVVVHDLCRANNITCPSCDAEKINPFKLFQRVGMSPEDKQKIYNSYYTKLSMSQKIMLYFPSWIRPYVTPRYASVGSVGAYALYNTLFYAKKASLEKKIMVIEKKAAQLVESLLNIELEVTDNNKNSMALATDKALVYLISLIKDADLKNQLIAAVTEFDTTVQNVFTCITEQYYYETSSTFKIKEAALVLSLETSHTNLQKMIQQCRKYLDVLAVKPRGVSYAAKSVITALVGAAVNTILWHTIPNTGVVI